MNAEKFQSLVDAIGWGLVHFSWQAAVVAAVLWIALNLNRRHSSARLRYAMSGLALFVLLVWTTTTFLGEWKKASSDSQVIATAAPVSSGTTAKPGVPIPVALAAAPAEESGAQLQGETPSPMAADTDRSAMTVWSPYLVAVWLLGVAVFSLRLLCSWLAVRRLKAGGVLPGDEHRDLAQVFSNLCHRMGLARPVRCLISQSARVPMVIGWFKPVVLVPAGILSGLSSAQLESILAHELAHIRRHDYLFNWLQSIFEALFFFHPAVWWIGAQLRKEREHCCDDSAAAVTGDPLTYATALTALEKMRAGNRTPALGLAASDGSLLARVRRLVAVDDTPRRSAWPALAFVPLAMIAFTAATWVFASSITPAEAAVGDGGEELEDQVEDVQTARHAGLWRLAGGVILEIDRKLIHASDISTNATLHWPDGGGESGEDPRRHMIGVAADAFAAREAWSVAWKPGESVLWIGKGSLGTKPQAGKARPDLHTLRRIDFSDPGAIKNQAVSRSGPPGFAPAEVLEALGQAFEVPAPEDGKISDARIVAAKKGRPKTKVKVVDGDSGKPIQSAEVNYFLGGKIESLTTDKNGEIMVPREIARNGRLHNATEGYLPAPSSLPPIPQPPLFGGADDPLVIKIYPGEIVEGRVLGPDGSPIAGATIVSRARIENLDTFRKLGMSTTLNSWDHGQFSNWGVVAKSDENGNYRYTRPAESDLSWIDLSCEAEGFAKLRLRSGIKIVQPKWDFAVGPHDFVLSKGVVVRLRVTDSEGNPLPGMSVGTVGLDGRHNPTKFGFSDAEGRFSEVQMMPGEYRIGAPRKVESRGNQARPRQRKLKPDELPLPFVAHQIKVEEGKETQDVTLRALPGRTVIFDWQDLRTTRKELWPNLVFEGQVSGAVWKTDLRLCDPGDGKLQLCARVPEDNSKGFLRMGKYNGVYHFKPAGSDEVKTGVTPVALREGGQAIGTIVAEESARVVLRIKHGGKLWGIEKDQIEVTADGRIGERELRGRSSKKRETWEFSNLYPGETITFKVDDPRFAPVTGEVKDLEPGEKRIHDIELIGRQR